MEDNKNNGEEVIDNIDTGNPVEIDIDTTDNIAQIRQYAKSLKSDLESYKGTHDLFGNKETAELASTVYSAFAGDEFDPDAFIGTVGKLSESRKQALFDFVASKTTTESSDQTIEKLFGGKVSEEDIEEFKKYKQKKIFGEGSDIPDSMLYNSDGSPKSEEEIAFLKQMKDRMTELERRSQQEQETLRDKETREREYVVEQQINSYGQDRLKILDTELKALGIDPEAASTEEEKRNQSMLKEFIVTGLSGLLLANPELRKPYDDSIRAIASGEAALAQRNNAVIEKNLIQLLRNESILGLFKGSPQKADARPELSKSGVGVPEPNKQEGRFNWKDKFKELQASGKLQ